MVISSMFLRRNTSARLVMLLDILSFMEEDTDKGRNFPKSNNSTFKESKGVVRKPADFPAYL